MIPDASYETAKSFTRARKFVDPLIDYPGDTPKSLDEAYGIQDKAIELWDHKVAGWKVGRIMGSAVEALGADRLAGPIFDNLVVRAPSAVIDMPVFEEGFAAVEGEIVILVKDDAPADKVDWTMEEAKAMVGSVHMGVEIASSPFGAINDHGPLVTISDFGNNYGVIIGEPIPEWESYRLAEWMFETFVEGECVGKASPDNIPGGPVGSLKFILENAARRGKPLKKGMVISTGAITGVHQVFVGQSSTVKCAGLSDIHVTFSALK